MRSLRRGWCFGGRTLSSRERRMANPQGLRDAPDGTRGPACPGEHSASYPSLDNTRLQLAVGIRGGRGFPVGGKGCRGRYGQEVSRKDRARTTDDRFVRRTRREEKVGHVLALPDDEGEWRAVHLSERAGRAPVRRTAKLYAPTWGTPRLATCHGGQVGFGPLESAASASAMRRRMISATGRISVMPPAV